jgi:hypothetical protein
LPALAVVLTMAWVAPSAQATTQAFTYTGAEQTFKVPGGVTSIHVVAIGGSGGSGNASGGAAAKVIGELESLTPGQTLYVEVGGRGKASGEGGAGGFNGGAAGGSPNAGGGGGASDVRTSPLASGLAPDHRIITAAGGGGGGGNGMETGGGTGGAAGNAGQESGPAEKGGGAGTPVKGGAGGEGCFGSATSGSLGSGGAGSNQGEVTGGAGGGGGGGTYGGGGGGAGCIFGGAGGAGGSSLEPLGGTLELASLLTAPEVQISYTLVPPSIAIVSPTNGTTYTQGQSVATNYSCTPPIGTSVSSCEGPVANGSSLDTTTLGPHTFTVEAEDADGATATKSFNYTVDARPSISIVSPINGSIYTQGQAVTAIYSCTPPEGTGVKTCAGPVANGSPLDTTGLGPHNFTVNAEDADGVTAEKSFNYTVVAASTPPPKAGIPDTILGSHPNAKLKAKKKVKVKFSFSSTTVGATFECKLDQGSFAPCTAPKSYKVTPGKHTFAVEAVSAAGTDPTPATFSFKVKKRL